MGRICYDFTFKHTPVTVRVYANEGIAQLIFLKAEEECITSYGDKKGKYQAQKEITLSKADTKIEK